MPSKLAEKLPLRAYPRLRVRGEIADIPVSGAWMPTGDGHHYFIVSPAVCKGAEARLGKMLEMRFFIDDQDRVDVPDALDVALNAAPKLRAVWLGLTPGKRRGFAHLVAQAKTSATVQRRIKDVFDKLAVTP